MTSDKSSDSDSQTESEGEGSSNKKQIKKSSQKPTVYILPQKLTEQETEELKTKLANLGGVLLSTLTPLHKSNDPNLIFISRSKAPKLVMVWVKKAFKSFEVPLNEDELNSLRIVSVDWLNESAKSEELIESLPFKIYLSGDKPPKESSKSASTSTIASTSGSGSMNASKVPSKRDLPNSSSSETESENDDKSKMIPTSSATILSDKGKGKERERSSSSASKRARISSGSASTSASRSESPTKPDDGEESEESELELDSDLPEHLDQVTIVEPEAEVPIHKATMPHACSRATPYKCVNQALVDELNLIKDKRALYQTKNVGSIAGNSGFFKAITAIKSFKYDLKTLPNPSAAAKSHMVGVGDSTEKMLKEFFSKRTSIGPNQFSIEGCKIQEAEDVRNRKDKLKMIQFSKLKGLTPQKAKKYYKENGIKTLKGLIKAKKTRLGTGLGSHKLLQIRKDVIKKVGRQEVELIRDEIVEEMISLVPDLKHTLVGSYRRGHPLSSSVDLVFTSPKLGEAKHIDSLGETQKTTSILDELMDRLIEDGKTFQRVTIFSPKTYEESQPISPVSILSFAYLPSKSFNASTSKPTKPIYRIVEINFCRPDVYGCQVLSRTGSKVFVSDVVKWAVENEYKFHATGMSSVDSPEDIVPTPEEKDVFDRIKLPYMPPHMRNCDP